MHLQRKITGRVYGARDAPGGVPPMGGTGCKGILVLQNQAPRLCMIGDTHICPVGTEKPGFARRGTFPSHRASP